ncbi:efflux RND transporter periplasmic adaptor subunit [Caulobacter segnis]|uniref:efflux RND transporter periplasmic adaptor subunit n=1 Tax=Caulobacter segnis TaxID=88688 RepID=UPI0028544AF3|nr:efflux RND transporter periplasmic adaptor subunit [Caulobacter segnis]MDR6624402.1 RND family efflux transporter MFP subunit [Caulobacter segnis]
MGLAGCAPKAKPATPPLVHVTTAAPLQRDIVDWDEYVGRFEAIQDVELRPRVSGTIVRVLFSDGQSVRAGQPLFVIDPEPYAAVLAQAQAQDARAAAILANARAEVDRAETLVQAQAIGREEFEAKQASVGVAAADLAAARANVRAAHLNLDFTTVRAPVSGRVSDRRVSVGNFASAGSTVLTRVVSLDPIWFSFDGAESLYLKYMRQAQAGQRGSSRDAPNPVLVQLADETAYRWQGKMSFVDNAIDTGSGTIRAHAVISNPGNFLTPGLFGRARLVGSGHYKALLVPDEAVVSDQTRRLVFVVDRQGAAQPRVVETGPMVQGLRVIKAGLAPTDQVVVEGVTSLRPGLAVKAKHAAITPRTQDTSPAASPQTAPPAAQATVD